MDGIVTFFKRYMTLPDVAIEVERGWRRASSTHYLFDFTHYDFPGATAYSLRFSFAFAR
jgi:hypothetical protein